MPPNTTDSIEGLFKDCAFGFDLRELIEFYVSSIYGIASIGLYIVQIVIILRNPKLKHPFYYQFVYLALMNMLFWIPMFFMARIIPHPYFCRIFYPSFKTPSNVWKPIVISYMISISGQLGTVMLININRASVILWPLKADKFWKKYELVTLGFVSIFSVIYSCPLWNWGAKVDWISYDHLTMQFTDEWPHVNPNLMTTILSVICLIVILASTVISLLTLWSHNASTREAEINLFWTNVAFSITTGLLVVFMPTMYFIYWLAYDEQTVSIFMDIRGFLYDVNCLFPAWLLLIINKPIRQSIWKIKSHMSSTITLPVQSNTFYYS